MAGPDGREHDEARIDALAAALRSKGIGTALVIASRLHEYAGAQLVMADLARTLGARGVRVTVAAIDVNRDFAEGFSEFQDAVEMASDPTPLLGRRFDLVYAHNWMAWGIALLECDVRFRFLVLASLSRFSGTEALWGITDDADTLHFVSPRALRDARESLGDRPPRTMVTNNPLPPEWFGPLRPPRPARLSRIAIVSNHVPPEDSEAAALLREAGITVEEIGKGGTPRLVTPELIDGVDAVVTIGHTVQKALSRGVPAFCYDHYGGPGYILPGNAEQAADDTFSGRGSSIRGGAEIAGMIREGFAEAVGGVGAVRETFLGRIALTDVLRDTVSPFDPAALHRTLRLPRLRPVRRVVQQAVNHALDGTPFAPEIMFEPERLPEVDLIRVVPLEEPRLVHWETRRVARMRFVSGQRSKLGFFGIVRLEGIVAIAGIAVRIDGRDERLKTERTQVLRAPRDGAAGLYGLWFTGAATLPAEPCSGVMELILEDGTRLPAATLGVTRHRATGDAPP